MERLGAHAPKKQQALTRKAYLYHYAYREISQEAEVMETDRDYGLFILPHRSYPPTCGYDQKRVFGKPRKCGDQLEKSYENLYDHQDR